MKPEDVPVKALQEGWADILKEARAHEPDWDPLEKVIPLEWCGGFMFMGYSGDIRLYKHGFTRNYLNLDPEGKPFRYTGRGYVPTSFEAAIEHVFDGLEERERGSGSSQTCFFVPCSMARSHCSWRCSPSGGTSTSYILPGERGHATVTNPRHVQSRERIDADGSSRDGIGHRLCRGREALMNEVMVSDWVTAYAKAWESNSPEDIGKLFTDDALYLTAPHREPWRGREGIVAGWLDHKDEPGGWSFRHELVAIAGDLAFVRGWTDYSDGDRFSNLWVIRLVEDGRCSEFTEWWMRSSEPV